MGISRHLTFGHSSLISPVVSGTLPRTGWRPKICRIQSFLKSSTVYFSPSCAVALCFAISRLIWHLASTKTCPSDPDGAAGSSSFVTASMQLSLRTTRGWSSLASASSTVSAKKGTISRTWFIEKKFQNLFISVEHKPTGNVLRFCHSLIERF